MPFPIALALQAAGTISSFLGGQSEARARRRQTRAANNVLARILPVQQGEFNRRFGLTETLNNLLLNNEAGRYNEVGGREVRLRGNLGDESIARFDDQVSAVDDQVATNRASVRDMLDAVQAATRGGIASSEAERARQRGYQTTADDAGAALLPTFGVAPDAARRAAAAGSRTALATDAIGSADTGGFAPETHSRIISEFARRGTKARDNAVGDASAAADASAYGDANAEVTRTLGRFNDMIGKLKTQAATSRGALGSELALSERQGKRAISDFDGRDSISKLLASGRRDIADTYRTGRMAAMDDAGTADIASLSNLFARLASSAQTGYGGQVSASERYENLFTNLMNTTASRIMGQTPSSPLTGLGSLLSGLSNAIPVRPPSGG